MPCEGAQLQTLITRNVNASRPSSRTSSQDGFELEQPNLLVSCQQLQDPFSVFCNIPQPADNDFLASMCNLQQETDNPNSYLQRLIRGQVSELDQMATIWESAHLPDTSDAWFPIADTTLQTFFSDGSYLGFDLFAVNDMSVSDNAQQLLLVRNGGLYQSCPDGFIHAVPDPTDEIKFLGGMDTANQSTTMSPRGFVRAALFADKFFFYGNGSWQPDLTPMLARVGIVYQSMKLWISKDNSLRLALFYSFQSATTASRREWAIDIFSFRDSNGNLASSFLTPIASIRSPQNVNPFFMGFLTIQPDNDLLYWSTLTNIGSTDPFLMTIYSANTTNYLLSSNTWQLQSQEPFVHIDTDVPIYTAALAQGSTSPQTIHILTLVFVLGTNMFQTRLQSESVVTQPVTTVLRGIRALSLHEALDHSRLMFTLNDTLRISCDLDILVVQGQTFALGDADLHYAYVFALSPTNGQDIWIIRNRKIFRLRNQTSDVWGSVWTNDFEMMFANECRVSDYGLPTLEKDQYVPSLAARWYLGTNTLAQEFNVGGQLLALPVEVARSAHQTFRYAVTSIKNIAGGLQTFPYAVGELQRANEYNLSQSAGTVTVDNDSNVTMSRGSTVLWQSNTHDRVSEQSGIVYQSSIQKEPFALSSNNGLYLLHKIPNRNRLRLVFNPFNASRMTEWCSQTKDRFNQAIQTQHDFCWNHLKIPDANFVDSRCACIGGFEFFTQVQQADPLQPYSIGGALSAAFPCYAPTCLFGKNGTGETATNVSIFTESRCNNRLLNLSQKRETIRNSDLTNNNFTFLNDAGNLRGTCSEEQPCDPGNTCVGGRCLAQCTSHTQCQQLFGLSQSSCVDGLCSFVTPPTTFQIQWWVIVALVCIVVLIVMILIFVAIATRKKNKK